MKKKATQKRPEKAAVTREDRLKAALKANLQRRKAQARARTEIGVADKEA
jgi:hypothetical protein